MTASAAPSVTALLTGPTASGKTATALEFARLHGRIEIINADSLLFYRDADIGTAKPTSAERAEIPHHLIDIRNPGERMTAGEFRTLALECIREIEARGRRALVVGGSGFYLKGLRHGIWDAPAADPALRAELEKLDSAALTQELLAVDPESAKRIGPGDRYRLVRALEIHRLSGKTATVLRAQESPAPDRRFPLFVVDRMEDEMESRIQARTRAMLRDGLLEETAKLEKKYGPNPVLESIGYAQSMAYLNGEKPAGRKTREGLPGLEDEIMLATRQLVKSQRTWFRKQPAIEPFQLDPDRARLLEALGALYS